MKLKKMLPLLLLLVVSLLATGCSGALPVSTWPGVTVSGNTAYLAHGLYVDAVNLQNGASVWRYPEKAENSRFYYAPPTVVDGVVVVGDYTNKLHALDSATGAQKWVFEGGKGRYLSAATLAGDVLLAASADHSLYAVDQSGTLQWSFKTDNANWASPATDGETVYLAGLDHHVYALKLSDGSLVWKSETLGGSLVSAPVLNNGQLVLTTLTGDLVTLDAQTGKEVWRTPVSETLWASPAIHENAIFIGSPEGKALAFAADTGALLWEVDLGSPVIAGAALTSKGPVFVSEKGEVAAMDFEGARLWTQPVNGKLYATPVVTEDRVLVAITGGDAALAAYDAAGALLWNYVPAK